MSELGDINKDLREFLKIMKEIDAIDEDDPALKDAEFKLNEDEKKLEENDPFVKVMDELQSSMDKLNIARKFKSDLEMVIATMHIINSVNVSSDNEIAQVYSTDIAELADKCQGLLEKMLREMRK